jgi:hypothetical protein
MWQCKLDPSDWSVRDLCRALAEGPRSHAIRGSCVLVRQGLRGFVAVVASHGDGFDEQVHSADEVEKGDGTVLR